MKRRFIPLLLAAALCLGLLTIGAAAEGPYTADDYRFVNVNGMSILNDPDHTVACGDGTATFEAETATLTLENATLDSFTEVGFSDVTSEKTLTVVLKGENSITTQYSGIYTNGNMVVNAEPGASIKVNSTSNNYNGFYAVNDLTIDGGTYEVSSGYPAFCSDADLTIQGGAKVVNATVSNDAAVIYAGNSVTITGEGTSVHFENESNGVFGEKSVTISNGAALSGTSNVNAVYSSGVVTIDNASFDAYGKSTAIWGNSGVVISGSKINAPSEDNAIYSEGNVSIASSTFSTTTDSTSIFSKGDINITDSVLNINSGANPINAWGTLSISGSGTVVTAKGAYPVAGGEIEISGGSVTVNTTGGTAISGDNGVTISGGSVNASTTAKMSAIYSANGDIEFEGADTKVSASSEQDSAIFTRNGSITLDAGVIEAKSAEGFAPVVARDSDEEEGTGESTSSIIIGENFATGGNIVATTVWKVDDNGNYYADTMLVPADTQLTEDGLLPEDYVPEESEIVVEKLADYSAVDAAVAKAQSLFKGDYVNFDIVERALAAVEYGLGASHQAEVDAMAKAITDAIAELQKIPVLNAETYAVNIAASDHGKVSANLSNASAGSVITLTATPDEGYELLSISVRDADGKPVALDGMKFTMPESSVTVTAVFGQGGLPFVDVSVNAWYYETVKAAYEAGLMNGVTDTEFAPNAPLTRAMIWTIIARASGVETEGGATWYAKAQEWVVANGVSDGEDPMGNVTREQLVTMLWRLNGSEVMTGYIGNYIDTGDISEWANNAMLWAVQNGIIEGDENMALAPKADTTRAQAATFFVRYLTVA